MSLTFYYGSGSPYAWKVWLALEHKQLAYEFKLLSFDRGDTRAPEFLALNPRGKLPVLVDDGFVIYESTAIVEYLEDTRPERPLLPSGPAARATVRRLAAEADTYLPAALRPFFVGREQASDEAQAAARQGLLAELDRFETYLGDQDFFAGALGLADFAVYPHVRLALRLDLRIPGLDVAAAIPPRLRRWLDRIAALPFHDRTLPPHWQAQAS